MKKLLALLLTFVLVLGLAVPAFGDNGENGEYAKGSPVWEMFERPFAGHPARSMFGYVGNIVTGECGNIYVEILNADREVQLIVWLLPELRFAVIDSQTGMSASLEDHDDNKVYVIYGPLTTLHDVPQSNALAIAINADEVMPGKNPTLATIEAIQWVEIPVPAGNDYESIEPYYNGYNGNGYNGDGYNGNSYYYNGDEPAEAKTTPALQITVNEGDLIVILTEETELLPYLTREILTLDALSVGDEVLLWLPFVALSIPAQSTATRLVRIGVAEYIPAEPYDDEEEIAPLTLVDGVTHVGINLYPVRTNVLPLGFEVVWNAEGNLAELTRDDLVITLAPNSAIFYVNGNAQTMSAPSLLEGGRLFAPEAFFVALSKL